MTLYEHLLTARELDNWPRLQQKRIIGNLAFAFYVRKGFVPDWVVTLQKLAIIAPEGFKFNPWHDDLGRFTTGPNSGVKPVSDAIGNNQTPKSWADPKTFEDHVARHGADFNAKSSEDYADQASQFYKRYQSEKLPAIEGNDGTVRIYDPQTNTFGSYNSDGTTKTFFKPSEGQAYFQQQIDKDLSDEGRIINPLPEPDAISEITEIPMIIE